MIPRNIRLGEAPSHGMPAVTYDAKSRGAEAYVALGREFLARDAALRAQTEPQPWLKNGRRSARGLSALIPDAPAGAPSEPSTSTSICSRRTSSSPAPRWTTIGCEDLARSIRANGVIQPIVVRRSATATRSSPASAAGARRSAQVCSSSCRGARDSRRTDPCRLALIENVQREDLNPIEEAHAYHQLAEEFHLTQEQIAESVGKDRSSIANYVRLLKLPHEVRESVASGALSMGHARALAGMADEAALLRLARDVIAKQLSVRETEALIRKSTTPPAEKTESPKDVHTRAAEEQLRFALGTRVRIVRKGKAGRIEVDFTSEDELQRIYELLTERH